MGTKRESAYVFFKAVFMEKYEPPPPPSDATELKWRGNWKIMTKAETAERLREGVRLVGGGNDKLNTAGDNTAYSSL
jgi:hypothetical protein